MGWKKCSVILNFVISSVVSVQQGTLYPQIVSPHLIVKALKCSSPSFPTDTSLPFALSKYPIHFLHLICEMQIYIRDDVLEYVIVLLKKTIKKHTTHRKEPKKTHQVFKHHT